MTPQNKKYCVGWISTKLIEGDKKECVLIPYLPSKKKHLSILFSIFSSFFFLASIPSCRCFCQHNLVQYFQIKIPHFLYVLVHLLNTESWKIYKCLTVIIINVLRIKMCLKIVDTICKFGHKNHGIRFFSLYHICGSILVPIVRC